MAAKTTAKKASANTEIVLGQAAQQITKAVAELNSATKSLSELTSQAEQLTLQVANKEEEIAALEVSYQEKSRQADVNLDLSMKANAEKVVFEYLSSTKKVAIPSADWTGLQKELETTKANADAVTKKEVAIATASVKSYYESEIKLIHADNKSAGAENAAKLGALVDKTKTLEDTIAKMYQQMDAERSASIERAKAGSVGSINVSSDRK